MITDRLQIGDSGIKDMYNAYGFIHVDSDTRFAPPTKGFESTKYVEEEGENIYPVTTDEAFDYKVTFLVHAQNADLESANSKIRAFNGLLSEQRDKGGAKEFRQVRFFNDYKKVMVTGYPQPIQEADKFWRDKDGNTYEYAKVEWTIRVPKPSLCNFSTQGKPPVPVDLKLATASGNSLMAITRVKDGAELPEGPFYALFLTCGRSRGHYRNAENLYYKHYKCSGYKWHRENVLTGIPVITGTLGNSAYTIANAIVYEPKRRTTAKGGFDVLQVRTSNSGKYVIPYEEGRSAHVTYGVAIYAKGADGKTPVRVSNVCYFKNRHKITADGVVSTIMM